MAQGQHRFFGVRLIRVKLNTLLLITVTAGLIIPSIATFLYLGQVAASERRQRELQYFHDYVKTIAIGLSSPLWDLNKGAVESFLHPAMDSNEIIEITVWDSDDNVFFTGSDSISDSSTIEVSAPIERNGNGIGKVTAKVSLRSMEAGLAIDTQRRVLAWGVMLTFTTSLVWFTVRNRIIRRVRRLREQAKTLAKKELSIPFDWEDTDEIGSLGVALESTRKALMESFAQIEGYNLELEKRVAERSSQLDEERAKTIAASRLASLGEMAAGMAHEINNPLGVIVGNTYKLKKLIASGNDARELATVANIIESTAQRIAQIVSGLKSITRNNARDPFVPTPVCELIKDAIALVAERSRTAGVQLTTCEISPSVVVACRPGQLVQVILNLLTNAIDASKPLEVRWVKVLVDDLGTDVAIRVMDSGKGVPLEVRRKLFQPFFTTKDVGKGTGLGLNISLKIAEAHDGSLAIDDTASNTCFLLRIPKAIHAAKSA